MIVLFASVCMGAENYREADITDYKILVDGDPIYFEGDVVSIEGKIYVPVRGFSESLGAEVDWEGENKTVNIRFSDYPNPDYFPDEHYESDNWTIFASENEYGYTVYGYMDENENVVIAPVFIEAKPFKEGRAVVSTCLYSEPLYGVIDEKGDYVLEGKYFHIYDYSEGLCAVHISKFGSSVFYDRNGQKAFREKRFIWANSFSEGYAVVKTVGDTYPPGKYPRKSRYSYINKYGVLATDKDWDYCLSFENGTAIVKEGDIRMRINTDFEVIEYLD